jgi:uncharacterized protein (TIGR00369 family)
MTTLGAVLERVAPGEVHIGLAFRPDLPQQHGFLHAGIVTSIVDGACGYAALSLMDAGAAVLSVEFKMQLLAPARAAWIRATGRVVRAGCTLTVVAGEVRARAGEATDDGELVALLNGTMMAVRDRPELRD